MLLVCESGILHRKVKFCLFRKVITMHLFDIKVDAFTHGPVEKFLEKNGFTRHNSEAFSNYYSTIGVYDTDTYGYFCSFINRKMTLCELLKEYKSNLAFDQLSPGDTVEVISCTGNPNITGDVLFITPEFKLENVRNTQGAIVLESKNGAEYSSTVAKFILESCTFKRMEK